MSDVPKDYSVVRGVESLKALAHPDRLRILLQLRTGPQSASEVGRVLELLPQRVSYHIKKMEAAGLVRFVRLGRKRWKEERLYVAVAKQFLIDPAFACDDPSTQAGLAAQLEVRFREGRREKTPGASLSTIARRVVGDVLDLRPGQRLLILSGPFSTGLVDALFVEVERRGAIAMQHTWGRSYLLGRLDAHSEEELAKQQLFPEGLDSTLDAVCQVTSAIPQGAPPNEDQRKKLPHLLRAVSDWQRDLRARGVPFVEVSLPARSEFQPPATPEESMDTFWRAIAQDPANVAERVAAVSEALAGAPALSIQGDGKLTLELVDEQELPGAGLGLSRGIPSGACTRLVRPGTASGKIRAAYTMAGGRRFPDLELTLEAGQLTHIEGGKKVADLVRRIDDETGDVRALASITVGVSPVGKQLTGKTSLDSILEGVVTLGFGTNISSGGTQSATLDLRFPLLGCTLEVDGTPLVL